jgi:hypothetical protein
MNPFLQQLDQTAGLAIRNSREALRAFEAQKAQNEQLVAGQNALRSQLQEAVSNQEALKNALSRLQVQQTQGDPNIQRIENIPGRRIPFDCLVEIPIPAGQTATQQQTYLIPQTGPFVAVARYATFLSLLQYQLLNENNQVLGTFNGRSFGRFRPISSVGDLNDGQIIDPVIADVGQPGFPGNGRRYLASVPSASPFRSMGGDFRIEFQEEGANIVRQNKPVPSPFWSKGFCEPVELPCLDFFERNSVLKFSVTPTRPMNPAFGNAFGFANGGNQPFADAQYDQVEGIYDEPQSTPTTDLVKRVPNGVLILGYFGYLIVQPAGAGPY